MTYAAAKRILDVVTKRFSQYGFPFLPNRSIIPPDDSTLFVCSGMQPLKPRFLTPDGSRDGSLQSCVRTNDLDKVGDGTHLTYFEMIGNFHFGGDYFSSCEMWHLIVSDLSMPISHVTFHPSRPEHVSFWSRLGYQVKPSDECVWSDGSIGGNCCEMFVGNLEVGNLVNTMGNSVDVGFGLERMLQVMENVPRVEMTEIFIPGDPIVSDHVRTLTIMRENGIFPGSKGRNFQCRRLLRRVLDGLPNGLPFESWIEPEKFLRDDKMRVARKGLRKFRDRPDSFWWETYGVTPEEVVVLKG